MIFNISWILPHIILTNPFEKVVMEKPLLLFQQKPLSLSSNLQKEGGEYSTS